MENVINGLRDMIGGFMKGLLGNLINVPLCAAEQLIGSLMSSITNKIQGLIGSCDGSTEWSDWWDFYP